MRTLGLCSVFFLAFGATAQCKLDVSSAPDPLGLKFGMSPSEASNVLGGRTVNPHTISSAVRFTQTRQDGSVSVVQKSTWEAIGESEYSFYPAVDTNRGQIYLRFWHDKLYVIALAYDIRDFLSPPSPTNPLPLARKFDLPLDGWDGMKLKCDGFYLSATVPDKSIVQIELTDSAAKSELQALAEKTIGEEKNRLRYSPTSEDGFGKGEPPVLKRKP